MSYDGYSTKRHSSKSAHSHHHHHHHHHGRHHPDDDHHHYHHHHHNQRHHHQQHRRRRLNSDLYDDDHDTRRRDEWSKRPLSPDSLWRELQFQNYLKSRIRRKMQAKTRVVDDKGRPVTLAERIIRQKLLQPKEENSPAELEDQQSPSTSNAEELPPSREDKKKNLVNLLHEYIQQRQAETACSSRLLEEISEAKQSLGENVYRRRTSSSARADVCSSTNISLGDSATDYNAKFCARQRGIVVVSNEARSIKGFKAPPQHGDLVIESEDKASVSGEHLEKTEASKASNVIVLDDSEVLEYISKYKTQEESEERSETKTQSDVVNHQSLETQSVEGEENNAASEILKGNNVEVVNELENANDQVKCDIDNHEANCENSGKAVGSSSSVNSIKDTVKNDKDKASVSGEHLEKTEASKASNVIVLDDSEVLEYISKYKIQEESEERSETKTQSDVVNHQSLETQCVEGEENNAASEILKGNNVEVVNELENANDQVKCDIDNHEANCENSGKAVGSSSSVNSIKDTVKNASETISTPSGDKTVNAIESEDTVNAKPQFEGQEGHNEVVKNEDEQSCDVLGNDNLEISVSDNNITNESVSPLVTHAVSQNINSQTKTENERVDEAASINCGYVDAQDKTVNLSDDKDKTLTQAVTATNASLNTDTTLVEANSMKCEDSLNIDDSDKVVNSECDTAYPAAETEGLQSTNSTQSEHVAEPTTAKHEGSINVESFSIDDINSIKETQCNSADTVEISDSQNASNIVESGINVVEAETAVVDEQNTMNDTHATRVNSSKDGAVNELKNNTLTGYNNGNDNDDKKSEKDSAIENTDDETMNETVRDRTNKSRTSNTSSNRAYHFTGFSLERAYTLPELVPADLKEIFTGHRDLSYRERGQKLTLISSPKGSNTTITSHILPSWTYKSVLPLPPVQGGGENGSEKKNGLKSQSAKDASVSCPNINAYREKSDQDSTESDGYSSTEDEIEDSGFLDNRTGYQSSCDSTEKSDDKKMHDAISCMFKADCKRQNAYLSYQDMPDREKRVIGLYNELKCFSLLQRSKEHIAIAMSSRPNGLNDLHIEWGSDADGIHCRKPRRKTRRLKHRKPKKSRYCADIYHPSSNNNNNNNNKTTVNTSIQNDVKPTWENPARPHEFIYLRDLSFSHYVAKAVYENRLHKYMDHGKNRDSHALKKRPRPKIKDSTSLIVKEVKEEEERMTEIQKHNNNNHHHQHYQHHHQQQHHQQNYHHNHHNATGEISHRDKNEHKRTILLPHINTNQRTMLTRSKDFTEESKSNNGNNNNVSHSNPQLRQSQTNHLSDKGKKAYNKLKKRLKLPQINP